MANKNRKILSCCRNLVKYSLVPFKRLKKLCQTNVRQYQVAVAAFVISSIFVTFILYYWLRVLQIENFMRTGIGTNIEAGLKPSNHSDEDKYAQGTPMMHVPLDKVYKDNNIDYGPDDADERAQPLVINTPGCTIPLFPPLFQANQNQHKRKEMCGKRAVFLKKVSSDKVNAMIKEKVVKSYLRKSALFECCIRFILPSNRRGHVNKKIRYTPCKRFRNGDIIQLESDFVNVKCSELRKNNISHEVYDDVYAFTKMINITDRPKKLCEQKYNILLLGMDSVSMARFIDVMGKTTRFFAENSWMGFRAFHKVGDNTLPNLIATLTGHHFTTFTQKCAGKMERCRELFIWNKFKEAGYITAYGEDFLQLPDTFHDEFAFVEQPTDHYLRPLFIKGERLVNKSLLCAGKRPSGQHLLDYALDFAVTYRSEQFFGMFWMNSYSHNEHSRPEDADSIIENFLNELTYTSVLENTFVVFFSDHGIRFGEKRLLMESYYDNRLPFLFIWSPTLFIGTQTPLANAIVMNQYKLVTHYDLYNTFVDIHRISACEGLNQTVNIRAAEGCPNCHSLFRSVSPSRSCADVAINEKWCSCHKMYRLDVEDAEVRTSVKLIMSHVRNISISKPTRRCWRCSNLGLKNVIRVHFYYDDKRVNLYHVVAFSVTPGNMSYEATVRRNRGTSELVGPVTLISPYNGYGKCVRRSKDRYYCLCQRIENCKL